MYREPEAWHDLMGRLSTMVSTYLVAQVDAGAEVVQLFDSWVGGLGPADYATFVQPHVRQIFDDLAGVPTIHFGTGTAALLELMAAAGGDVIGIDHRQSLGRRLAAGRPRPRRPGQSRCGPPARRLGGHRSGRAAGPRRGRRPARARLQPGPRRPAGDRHGPAPPARRLRPRADGPSRRARGGRSMTVATGLKGALLMTYGSPADARAGRRGRVPGPDPRRPGGGRRAPRRVHPALPGHRRLAADPDHPCPGRGTRGELGWPATAGHALLGAVDRRRAPGARRSGRRRRSPRSSCRRSTRHCSWAATPGRSKRPEPRSGLMRRGSRSPGRGTTSRRSSSALAGRLAGALGGAAAEERGHASRS